MQKITSVAGLKDAIRQLEEQETFYRQLFKQELHLTVERLRPINLIRSAIIEAFSYQRLFDKFFSVAINHTTGYVSKKVAVGETYNPIKKFVGTIIKSGVTVLLNSYANKIKETAILIFKSFLDKRSNRDDDPGRVKRATSENSEFEGIV